MQANLQKKAKELGPGWNAELVGRALWTEATVFRYIDSVKGGSAGKKDPVPKKAAIEGGDVVIEERASRKRTATSNCSEASTKKVKAR